METERVGFRPGSIVRVSVASDIVPRRTRTNVLGHLLIIPATYTGRVVSAGMVFISADYRLLPPATGHDILADILDLFRFLQHQINQCIEELLQTRASHAFHIDTGALAVAGSSAGSLCAYLAAIHAVPKPKAVLSLYGMGGNFLVSGFIGLAYYHRRITDYSADMAVSHPQDQTLFPWARNPRPH